MSATSTASPSTVDHDRIPAELRVLPQWVAHKDKAPYVAGPRMTRRASTTDPATWRSFEDAVSPQWADGLGFVFTVDDPYVGVDLDGCVTDGTIDPAAQEIIDRLDSYYEISPSGTGVHGFVRGGIPRSYKVDAPWQDTRDPDKRGKIEVYDHGRYFTVTGDGQGEIAERTEALQWLAEQYPPRSAPAATLERGDRDYAAIERGDWDYDGTDEELLAELLANDRFAELHGTTPGDGDDWSKLDYELCCRIAELTGNPDRIAGAWGETALAKRKKFERADYRQLTIARALGEAAAERYESPAGDPRRPAAVMVTADPRREDDDGDWESTPTPGLPDYPDGVFTGVADAQFREMVRGGIPAGFSGAALLGAAAVMLGNSCHVDHHGRVQYPTLWIPIVGGVSSAKTPAFTIAFGPIFEINAQLHSKYLENLAEYKRRKAEDRKDPITRPQRHRVTIGDTTIEALARTLDKQSGAVAVVTDEIGGFIQSLGQYKQHSSDRDIVLGLWSQAPWEYARVGSGKDGGNDLEIYIPRPVVSICGTLQFERADLLGTGGDGLRARWLLHAANPVPPVPMPARTLDSWRDLITDLWDARSDEVIADRHWVLTDDAAKRFHEQQVKWSRRARELGQTPEGGAAGKADTHCLRVALVLAELEQPGADRARISLDVIERAILVVDFSVGCWADQSEAETLGLTFKDQKLAHAVNKMRAWLRGHDWVQQRVLDRAHVGGARTKAEKTALYKRYQETYPANVKDVDGHRCFRA